MSTRHVDTIRHSILGVAYAVVSHELIKPDVALALRTVDDLKRGLVK